MRISDWSSDVCSSDLAAKADKTKAHASGGSRAIGLRTYYTAELVDTVAALKHYKQAQPEALKAWLLDQGQKDVSAGKRAIPGFEIKEDRRAARSTIPLFTRHSSRKIGKAERRERGGEDE